MSRTTVLGLLLCGAALLACGGRDGAQESARAAPLAADTTPPAVVSTSPGNGATGAAINGLVVATFSEAMDSASIDASTFTLAGPAGSVSGQVIYDVASASAAFVPAALLATNTLYIATITTGVRDQAGNFLRAPVMWSFTTARAESTPPKVTTTIPASGATLAPNSAIVAVFSEAMNPATVNEGTFTVVAAGGTDPLAGTVQYDQASRSAILTAPLAGGTSYTATITTGALDLAGNALAGPATFTFTTSTDADVTQPAVLATAPSGTNVPAGTPITATFGEPVDPRTVTAATFTLEGASGTVSGSVTFDPAARTATFTPASALARGREYTARVPTGVRDLAGNALAAPAAWTFSLAVRYSGFVSNRYEDNDWHVKTNANAWWGSPLRNDRGLRLSWVVTQQGDHWRYVYKLDGAKNAVNKPVNSFALETPEGFESTDLRGGWSLVEPVNDVIIDGEKRDGVLTDVTSFLTRPAAAEQYTTANLLRSLFGIRWQMSEVTNCESWPNQPCNFQKDVANTMFILTFSSRRAPAWGDVVIESAEPSGGGLPTAWNTHLGDWTDAVIADGNNGGWVLVPGVLGADTEAPDVLEQPPQSGIRITHPAAGSVGLGVHDSVTVTFTEAVEGTTLIDNGAFTLADGSGTPVSGQVTYDPLAYVARFTPDAPLVHDATYTAAVAGVSDLAGHTMASAFTWTFTTEPLDTTVPRVISTTPAKDATGVAVGEAVSANFSEAIDSSNLSEAFTVDGVPGAVTYDPATNRAIFTPATPLAYDTTYTAAIRRVRDLTGNVMLEPYLWRFTTASPPPYVPTGDLNGDGIVDVLDARLALRIAAHEIEPSSEQLRTGDVAPLVDGVPAPDGKIDVGDVLVILGKIAGAESW